MGNSQPKTFVIGTSTRPLSFRHFWLQRNDELTPSHSLLFVWALFSGIWEIEFVALLRVVAPSTIQELCGC